MVNIYFKQFLLVMVRMSLMLELLLEGLSLELLYLLFCVLLLCCFCTNKEEDVFTMLNSLKVYCYNMHVAMYVHICKFGTAYIVDIKICHIISDLQNYEVPNTLPSTILMQNIMFSDGTQKVRKCFRCLIHTHEEELLITINLMIIL